MPGQTQDQTEERYKRYQQYDYEPFAEGVAETMSVSVRMPQLGESVTEGTVTRWLKKEGDLVNADEPLLEVSTDKVDTEIPSPASGVLRGSASLRKRRSKSVPSSR